MVLMTRPPWSTARPVASCSKPLDPLHQLALGQVLALGGVADDVHEADRHLGLGGAAALDAQQPAGRAGEVAAPDVGLEGLDAREHPGGQLGHPDVRVRSLDGVPREQAGLPLREPGVAAAPRADQRGLRVVAEDADPHQVRGQLQRPHVALGEGDRRRRAGGRSRAGATAPSPARGVRRPARPPGRGSGWGRHRGGRPPRRRRSPRGPPRRAGSRSGPARSSGSGDGTSSVRTGPGARRWPTARPRRRPGARRRGVRASRR